MLKETADGYQLRRYCTAGINLHMAEEGKQFLGRVLVHGPRRGTLEELLLRGSPPLTTLVLARWKLHEMYLVRTQIQIIYSSENCTCDNKEMPAACVGKLPSKHNR